MLGLVSWLKGRAGWDLVFEDMSIGLDCQITRRGLGVRYVGRRLEAGHLYGPQYE